MIDSYFRSHYQKAIVNPLLPFLASRSISPHMCTAGAFVSGMVIYPALFFQHSRIAFFLMLLSGFLDTMDGSIARIKNQTTSQGSVLDIISDRLVELAVILGLYSVDPESRGFLSLLMLGSAFICVTSFLVVGIFIQNEGEKSFHYSPGIMERAEAFIFFGAMMLLPSLFIPLSIAFIILVFTTAFIRVYQFCSSR
jgi:phosphatidylglycerophosphate synthase